MRAPDTVAFGPVRQFTKSLGNSYPLATLDGAAGENDGDIHLASNGRVMSLAISAASNPAQLVTRSSATAPSAQQHAALTQLLSKYAYDQSHGVAALTLSSLGKQIMAAAKGLGQNVTLPRSSGAAPAVAATTTSRESDKLNVTA
jgi:hypothetical protein